MRTQGKTDAAPEGTEMEFQKHGLHLGTTMETDYKQLFLI